jgi:hypothetical protein
LASKPLTISGISAADITASNAHRDRGPFDSCGSAIDKLDDSLSGTRASAVHACANSMIYYARKLEISTTEDDDCVNELYAGSSAARYGQVLRSSMNQAASKKAMSFASKMLGDVLLRCKDEPNISLAAKGVMEALDSF